MRMWMCDPSILCRKHLLGEHCELHKFRPSFVKGISITGRRGQIEPESMQERHDELAKEMVKRGFNHNSPYEQPDLSHYNLFGFTVNKEASLIDLYSRCDECRRVK